MRAFEFLREGGWDSTVTQGTVIGPGTVKQALSVVQQFTQDFNRYLQDRGLGPVEMGRPTGSSAYHDVDAEDKVYGDIDLQMIGPEEEGQSIGQFNGYWNKLAADFVQQHKPAYVHPEESKPGHPIIAIGNDQYVQVDFMWHPERLSHWGAARVTPERGVKGSLMGNMFSVLGELMDMSIQHAGVQLKVVDGQRVPFSKQKNTETVTVSTDPNKFILDIFKYELKQLGVERPVISPLLQKNSGIDVDNVKIATMVAGVKGLAASFEANDMFGQGNLQAFSSADDFLTKFLQRYQEKAEIDINSKKRDKAQTPDAVARAEADRQKVLTGLEMVKGLFR
jgi:hypothetical protein